MSKKTKAEKPKKLDPKHGQFLTEKGAELDAKIKALMEEKKEVDAELREFPAGTVFQSGPYQVEIRPRTTLDLEALHKEYGKLIEVVVPKQVIAEHRIPSAERAEQVLTKEQIAKFRKPLTSSLYYGLRKDADK